MRVDKIRIQHFQCIADSGEIALDEKLTVLVGGNESGKTAILKALWYFNQGNNFEEVDISNFSGILDRIHRGEVRRESVDIVTVWLTLFEQDLAAMGMTEKALEPLPVLVVKTLENEYRIDLHRLPTSPQPAGRQKLLDQLTDLKGKIQNIYKGRVKRKLLTDYFVWIEQHEDESWRDNLVLFPEWAPGVWDDLGEGTWIQVTRLAEDPLGRNTRALNAGLEIDVRPFIDILSRLIDSGTKNILDLDALREFQLLANEVPSGHPLRDYLSSETVKEIIRLSTEEPQQETAKPVDILDRVKKNLPDFVYLPALSELSDSMPIKNLSEGASQEPDVLFSYLTKIAGLQPSALAEESEIVRKRILAEKSGLLTGRLQEYWINKDLSLEFEKQGQRLAVWVKSSRSIDPPSRRSRGLISYLALFAKLAELSTRRNVVAMLDDPGINLHPVAQKQLLPLLDSQPFQLMVATHLPFMIDPDHIERVRVVNRPAPGTRVEHDWSKARESLLPVWGSIVGGYAGKFWLVVEGITDKRAYLKLSGVCRGQGKPRLPDDIPIVPGGGRQLVHLVRELVSRGIPVVVLLDGDREGQEMQKELRKLPGLNENGIVTLAEAGLSAASPDLRALFATQNDYQNAVSTASPEGITFDAKTIEDFSRVFSRITEALSRISAPSGG